MDIREGKGRRREECYERLELERSQTNLPVKFPKRISSNLRPPTGVCNGKSVEALVGGGRVGDG